MNGAPLRLAAGLAMVAGLACAGCNAALPVPGPALPDPTAADAEAFAAFPSGLSARAAALLPSDASGLIGRNRTWGALYSPRFQLGAGAALRTALAAGEPGHAARAFRAVEVASEAVQPDGSVRSTLPPEIGAPSATDVASGAAFALGDACLGLLALEATPRPDAVASPTRRAEVRSRLTAGTAWLLTQTDRLWATDAQAPNRLLFDARTFQACGALAADSLLRARTAQQADAFTQAALAQLADDGHFVEAGGHDTSYQGVALLVGEDLLLAGSESAALAEGLARAADWLAGRVGADGRIDSAGNARTCDGGETFGGVPKRVAVVDVFAGLAYAATRTGSDVQAQAARRVEAWALANPNADPCFSAP